MSKRNRLKREQNREQAGYPFKMLHYWMKSFVSQGQCRCGRPSTEYALHHFLAIKEMQCLAASGKSDQQATEVVWQKALAEQQKGIYTVRIVTSHCKQCSMALLEQAVGENAATLAMMPMMLLGDRSSVIVGAKLLTKDDDGKLFAAMTHAKTIEELRRHIRGEEIAIHLSR